MPNIAQYFNPRAPQGARQRRGCCPRTISQFQSTRSAGSATVEIAEALSYTEFQSTRSAGSATCSAKRRIDTSTISIHALRRERDFSTICSTPSARNFNPRAPQGARPYALEVSDGSLRFQSTRSAGSATSRIRRPFHRRQISIHALRRERDIMTPQVILIIKNFNPRAPQGARLFA